jgi:hypothetical protein
VLLIYRIEHFRIAVTEMAAYLNSEVFSGAFISPMSDMKYKELLTHPFKRVIL